MNERFSKKLILNHVSGAILFPFRMKNRDTGQIAFRLSKKGNTKADSIEVVDELEMIEKVTKQNYTVRARTIKTAAQGGYSGLYRLKERSIRDYKIQF